jgi:hypothetical protein
LNMNQAGDSFVQQKQRWRQTHEKKIRQLNFSFHKGRRGKCSFFTCGICLQLLINVMGIDLIGRQLTSHCRPHILTFLAEDQRDNFVQQLKLSQKKKKKSEDSQRDQYTIPC